MRYLITLIATILRISLLTLFSQSSGLLSRSHRQVSSRKDRTKRGWVKTIWLVAGLLILLNPTLPVILIIALPTTFLSFMILDEIQ
ncbi:hypothetical protein [Endozoicomonas sp.]|uniref:hypothetical protein n=1 Tax=Endozoicomonas sp. TaxID=1892382 RepID=UPI003839DC94